MSFLKKLFDKLKPDDDKYGKGHRLGDLQQEEERRRRETEAFEAAQANSQRQKTSVLLRPNSNDAALAAGQAALARLQPKHQTTQKQPSSSTILQKQSSQFDEEKRRLEEAERLKEHYFGTSHIREQEASSHLTGQKIEINFKCPDLFGEGLSLSKVKLEERIEDKLMENLNDEPILTSTTLLLTLNYKNEEKLQKCLETLTKIVDNIVANPNEEKYRKIRCENAQIKEKLLSCNYCELVLTVIGFKLLKTKKPDCDEFEDVYVFDHEDEKNYSKLNELKEAFKIVKPIKPVLDRNIVLLRINETSQAEASRFNLADDFQSLSINEIKREQKLREEALEKSGHLRTKAMRERDEIMEMRKYNYCLIRVKFSDLIYLQMIFKSSETIKDLYLCVQSCLNDEGCSFDLSNYVLKPQQQNFSQTFAEAGLTPAALLHFRANQAISTIGLEIFKEHLLFNLRNSFS